MAQQLPRGIDPALLASQVKNTMPYLFEEGAGGVELERLPAAEVLREFEGAPSRALSHFEYFRLCLCSHYLSCGTPVPTDVDNQIRRKLWPAQLPLETALEMAGLVLESRSWDFTQVTGRFACGAPGTPWEHRPLSGHLGEWFTVASGAYCALARYSAQAAKARQQELLDAVADEVRHHSEVFGSLWKSGDGLGCLKASASIAHNFGDLDRVMDMWELSVGDPLRLRFYKLAMTPFDPDRKLRYLGRLWVAGELYKSEIEGSSMALENHRHFALRKPRSLRRERAFLVPTGPFFDGWGGRVARGLASGEGAPSEDTLEVVDALKHGWERLPKTLGYGRALRGMLEVHPGLGLGGLRKSPHELKAALETPQDRFERKWASEALRLMDDIPSRA